MDKNLAEKIWHVVMPVLQIIKLHRGRPQHNPKKAFLGILYVLENGIKWSCLPRYYGAKSTVHGKMTLYVGNNGSKLNFFGFSHNDWVTFNESSDLQWKSGGGGANFFIIPGEANVNIDGVFSYSNYEISTSLSRNSMISLRLLLNSIQSPLDNGKILVFFRRPKLSSHH